MDFSRPEYCSGVAFPFSRGLPNPGIGARSPALQVGSLPYEPPGKLFYSTVVYYLCDSVMSKKSKCLNVAKEVSSQSSASHNLFAIVTSKITENRYNI